MNECNVGEFVVTSVDCDGMMNGFDLNLVNSVSTKTNIPIIVVGGGGNMMNFNQLFLNSTTEAVGSASIFHFTQYTPLDIKRELQKLNKPVRV